MRTHRYIYTLLAIIALASCSSDEQLSKVDVIGNDNPMRFGIANAQEESTITRASSPLQAGFKVSTYKSFGDATKQQVVMGGYKVDYTESATKKWNYVGINGQIERYWDANGYPYDFRACTPFIAGASLTDTDIYIDMTATDAPTFKAQTFLEDATTKAGNYNQTEAESEACMISHVQRLAANANDEYCDYDLLKPVDATTYTEINTAAKTPVRDVHLPFHHLMSKVGFRFYIDDPSVPTYEVKMKDVTISIVTESGKELILESKKYTAGNDNMLSGTFSELTRASSTEQPLITKTDAYAENIGNNLNHETAFDFKCPGDMVQIPQKDLKIHVKLTLDFKGDTKDFDRYLSIDDTKTEGDLFNWDPNTHYIYYLHLKNLEKYPIILCTAEIVPWDVVKTEDIEIGL